MILEEEKIKYKELKEKLKEYREQFDVSKAMSEKSSNEDVSIFLSAMYARMIEQYDKNKNKSYFAKIIFKPTNEKETVAYIGRIGFANLSDEDIIVDWRAPISELYYNGKIGKVSLKVEDNDTQGELSVIECPVKHH